MNLLIIPHINGQIGPSSGESRSTYTINLTFHIYMYVKQVIKTGNMMSW